MTSTRALRYSLEQIAKMPFKILAPQHGSIIDDKEIIEYIFKLMASLKDVGIDGLIDEAYQFEYGALKNTD
jgi:flavorubredoxin